MARVAKVAVDLEANSAKFTSGLNRADKALSSSGAKWSRTLKKIDKGFASLGGAVAKVGAVTAVAATGLFFATKKALEAADSIAKTADKIGLSTDALQELRYAANLAGVEERTLDMAMQRFIRRTAEAAKGTGEAKDALKQLGISLTDASGKLRTGDALLQDVADAMAKIPDQGERVRLSFKLFDSEGVAMVNMLMDGSAGLQKMRDDAQRLGIVMDESLIRNAEKAKDELDTLSKIIAVQATSAIVNFAPEIQKLTERFIEGLPHLLEWVDGFGRFIGLIESSDTQRLGEIAAEIDAIQEKLKNPFYKMLEWDAFSPKGTPGPLEREMLELEKEYNRIVDRMKQNQAPAPSPGIVSAGVGSTAVSEEITNLQKAAADANFELSLLQGNYSDAKKDALKFARAQGLLNQALGDKPITPEALKAYDDYLASLEKLDAKQKEIIENEKKQKTGLQEYADAATDTMAQIDNVTVSAFRSMEDALVDFVRTGKMDFRSLADSIISDLIRMQIQQSITGPLAGAMSGAGGLGGIFAGMFGGSSMYATAGTTGAFGPSFAGGGHTGNAPRSGGLDGMGGFLAMLHPQESVIDHTMPGSFTDGGASGGTYYIDARGADQQGMAQLREQIAAVNGSIEQRSVAAVMNANRRGGGARKGLA